MNPKLRCILTAVLSVLEVLALTIAVPIVVLAIVAYILLMCVRAVGGSVRDVAPRDQGSQTTAYDAAGS